MERLKMERWKVGIFEDFEAQRLEDERTREFADQTRFENDIRRLVLGPERDYFLHHAGSLSAQGLSAQSQFSRAFNVPLPYVSTYFTTPIEVDDNTPETLKDEYDRQTRIMAQVFAPWLGMTEYEYISTLPPFEPMPPINKFKEIIGWPVIVEGRGMSWEAQALFSGINIQIPDTIKSADFKTPDKPFSMWLGFEEQSLFPLSPAGILAGIAFKNAYPNHVQGRRLVLERWRDNIFT